jgi:hypothetical protein
MEGFYLAHKKTKHSLRDTHSLSRDSPCLIDVVSASAMAG